MRGVVLSAIMHIRQLFLFTLPAWIAAGAILTQQPILTPQPHLPQISTPTDLSQLDNQLPALNSIDPVTTQQLLTAAWKDVGQSIETMQSRFFEIWLGTWPSAIDWTRAVMGTHVNGVLCSLTRSLGFQFMSQQTPLELPEVARHIENDINTYFTQAVTYFFGEDALAVRNQAFDDMLWIVLGWLENIRFTKLHTDGHNSLSGNYTWYGNQFVDGFAHRARIFYQLAEKGWDRSTCGGGVIWNPRLEPYKNAITNQLFISASINMYLHFPGDDNESPFRKGVVAKEMSYPPHAPGYLIMAIEAYDWLRNSGMTNSQGLYIDGFHIRDGVCNVRNEMVYTYNQGVILSGLRGLWESTGEERYLVDGHILIQNTIAATGYSLTNETGYPPRRDDYSWAGLGRNGVLEDHCDASGTCSQDSQTFKGIYFHHLTSFCESLPLKALIPGKTYAADPELAERHSKHCKRYEPWVTRNALAAMFTRNDHGQYGMWWSAPAFLQSRGGVDRSPLPKGAEDYRSRGLGDASLWGTNWHPASHSKLSTVEDILADLDEQVKPKEKAGIRSRSNVKKEDMNDRGRGRTVETQSGGVAVVRSMWEFLFHHSATSHALQN